MVAFIRRFQAGKFSTQRLHVTVIFPQRHAIQVRPVGEKGRRRAPRPGPASFPPPPGETAWQTTHTHASASPRRSRSAASASKASAVAHQAKIRPRQTVADGDFPDGRAGQCVGEQGGARPADVVSALPKFNIRGQANPPGSARQMPMRPRGKASNLTPNFSTASSANRLDRSSRPKRGPKRAAHSSAAVTAGGRDDEWFHSWPRMSAPLMPPKPVLSFRT